MGQSNIIWIDHGDEPFQGCVMEQIITWRDYTDDNVTDAEVVTDE